jgi:hypothetical protein
VNDNLRLCTVDDVAEVLSVADIGFEELTSPEFVNFLQVRALATQRVKVIQIVHDRQLAALQEEGLS